MLFSSAQQVNLIMALYIICFAAGVLITAVIAYFFHLSSVRETLSTANEKVRNFEQVYSNLTEEKQELQNELDGLLSRANKAESQNDLLKQHSFECLLFFPFLYCGLRWSFSRK